MKHTIISKLKDHYYYKGNDGIERELLVNLLHIYLVVLPLHLMEGITGTIMYQMRER